MENLKNQHCLNSATISKLSTAEILNYSAELPNWLIGPDQSSIIAKFEFKNFVDAEADYSGNELTGVANKKWNFGLDINTKKGFSINISHLTVGKIPMNDSNSKYSKEYSLLDIK